MQLWLIPILPLAGFLINGIFGRRFSKSLSENFSLLLKSVLNNDQEAIKGLPPEIKQKLESAIVAAASAPEVKSNLAAQGIASVTKGADEFTKYIKAEHEKWAKVIKERGLKL